MGKTTQPKHQPTTEQEPPANNQQQKKEHRTTANNEQRGRQGRNERSDAATATSWAKCTAFPASMSWSQDCLTSITGSVQNDRSHFPPAWLAHMTYMMICGLSPVSPVANGLCSQHAVRLRSFSEYHRVTKDLNPLPMPLEIVLFCWCSISRTNPYFDLLVLAWLWFGCINARFGPKSSVLQVLTGIFLITAFVGAFIALLRKKASEVLVACIWVPNGNRSISNFWGSWQALCFLGQ